MSAYQLFIQTRAQCLFLVNFVPSKMSKMTQPRRPWDVRFYSPAARPRVSACTSSTSHLLNLHTALESLQPKSEIRAGVASFKPHHQPQSLLHYLNCTRQAASNYRRIKRDQHVQFNPRDHAGKEDSLITYANTATTERQKGKERGGWKDSCNWCIAQCVP